MQHQQIITVSLNVFLIILLTDYCQLPYIQNSKDERKNPIILPTMLYSHQPQLLTFRKE